MFVFVCWTPYQVLNAMNFVLSDVEGAKGNADIYIYHDFSASEKLSEALKNSGIFNNVYDVEVYDKRRKIWYSKFAKIKRLLMPYSTIKHFLKADIDVRKQGYKTLIIAGNNLFSINMYNAIKGLQVYFIDDGNGTYIGDMRERDITLIYKIFNIIFNRGPMSYDVKKLYVNNKDACRSTICKNMIQLPRLSADSEVLERAKKVFGYIPNTTFKDNKYIYLTQPLYETAIGDRAPEIEKTFLSAIKDNVLVRIHPRQNAEDYAEYKCDEAKNLWEIECLSQINDNHVLIGGFSTAQFVPKLLFDCEPKLIFTYKLYGCVMPSVDEMIKIIKDVYRNPERIYVPETIEELMGIFQEEEQ